MPLERFAALVARWREDQVHRELLTGILASTVANFAGKSAAKILGPSHFMPSQVGKVREPKRQSLEEQFQVIRMIHRQQQALNGASNG